MTRTKILIAFAATSALAFVAMTAPSLAANKLLMISKMQGNAYFAAARRRRSMMATPKPVSLTGSATIASSQRSEPPSTTA